MSIFSGCLTLLNLNTSKTSISISKIGYYLTFEELVFLLGIGLKIKNKVIQFFYHELVFLKTFVSYVEDRVFVCGLVVHVENNVSFRNGHYV